MNDNLLTIFIGVTAGAVLLQAGIMVALYLAVRKSTAKMEALATEVTSKALPTIETAQSMLVELRPKIENLTDERCGIQRPGTQSDWPHRRHAHRCSRPHATAGDPRR